MTPVFTDILANTVDQEAFDVSLDGKIVGSSVQAGPPSEVRAFLRVSITEILPHRAGTLFSVASTISADGTRIGGSSAGAVYWPGNASPVFLGGTNSAGVQGVSADGAFFAGGQTDNPAPKAFRWKVSPSITQLDLGDLSGGQAGDLALSISDDGATVVGWGTASDGNAEAFRWDLAGGMVGIGRLPAHTYSEAHAVASDGGTIVGCSAPTISCLSSNAFIWDARNGIRDLKTELEQVYGLSLTGWTLRGATDLSSNGLTIVGAGVNPAGLREAWVAKLNDEESDGLPDGNDNCIEKPNGPTIPDLGGNIQFDTDIDDYGNMCDCDFNESSGCDIQDFNLFLVDFQAAADSGIGSDMNGDGSVGIQDYNLFLEGFQEGKPGPSSFHSVP